VAAVAIVLVGLWSQNAVQRTLEGRLRSELGTALEANVTALGVWIQGQMRTASLLAADPSIREPAGALLERARTNPPPAGFGSGPRPGSIPPPEADPVMGSLIRTLDQRLLLTGYPGAVLVGPRGRVVAAFGRLRVRPGSPVPTDHHELYQRVLTYGRPALVTPFRPVRPMGRGLGGPRAKPDGQGRPPETQQSGSPVGPTALPEPRIAPTVRPGVPATADRASRGTSRFLGTPLYMAPETIRQPGHGDIASDLYALSAVAFVLVTGRPLFPASSVEEVWRHHLETPAPRPSESGAVELSEDFERLILDGLSKDPAQRPADMGVFLERLERSPKASEWTPERRRAWWTRFRPGGSSGEPRISRRTEATLRIDLSLRTLTPAGPDTAEPAPPGDSTALPG